MNPQKYTFFFIHGAYGHPGENWFPYAKAELEKEGHKVIIPKMPTPEGQSLGMWKKAFEPNMHLIDENTVFVGHSIGPAFIISLLETTNIQVRACFFVSGFVSQLGIVEFDSLNRTFVERDIDWVKVRGNCRKFVLLHSDDDPYVPWDKAEELRDSLSGDISCQLVMIRDGGHLNSAAGYSRFPLLVDMVKEELSRK